MKSWLGWLALRLGLFAVGLVAALCAAELALRALTPESDYYYAWWPGLVRVFHPRPGVLPGVTGESVFRANSIGLRGDELAPQSDFRVLAVGGSTTECLFLDQAEAWPQMLQEGLAQGAAGRRVWVANAGKSGHTSRDHITMLEHLLPQLPDLDLVLLLVGTNDLNLWLAEGEDYDPDFRLRPGSQAWLLLRSFQLLPVSKDPRIPLHKRTRLWSALRRVATRLLPSRDVQDDLADVHELWRAHRRCASAIRTQLPDMQPPLGEYRRNLHALIDLCEQAGVRAVLLTQPAVWFDGMPEEVLRTLWMGGVGDFLNEEGCEYYSHEAMQRGMQAYNEVLREVAAERGVEVCDLDRVLSGDPRWFYDDVHFNEAGSARVAQALTRFLLEREPFAPAVR